MSIVSRFCPDCKVITKHKKLPDKENSFIIDLISSIITRGKISHYTPEYICIECGREE